MRRLRVVVCAAAFAATVALNAAGSAVASSGWSIQPTPNPTGRSSVLYDVSCPAPAVCTAVGNYTNASGNQATRAERWNGTAWKTQPTPNPSGAPGSSLSGVSCTAANACTAVGQGNGTLAERWNGTAWSIQPTPNAAGASFLYGVSCTAATACTAVGYSGGATLAERWNGTAWSIQPTPNAGVASVLYRVSCTAATACTAVGYSRFIGCGPFHCIFYGALAERWNGATWTIQSGLPAYRSQITLTGVSCNGTSACTGVGYYNASTLAAAWNGTTWATQPTPNPTGSTFSELSGVSCTAANACTAVGQGNGTLAEQWNGTAWSIQPTPNPTGATGSYLSGVSCTASTASTACTAVGVYANSSGTDLTLAERYSG